MTARAAWIAASIGMLAGCGGIEAPASDTVVRIGDRELSYEDFEAYLELNSLEGEVGLPSSVLSGLFDQFVLEELLLRAAREAGYGDADRRRAIEAMIADRVAGRVDSSAVEAEFAARRDEFELPERVDLRQILVAERAVAERALARLRAGAPFDDVAAEVQEGEAERSWVQRGLTRDDLPDDVAASVFPLAPGEVSDIIEADYGFLIFEVTARRPGEQLSLADVAPELRVDLERRAADRALSELAEEAARRYNVEVFEQNLPFEYLGSHP